MAQVWEYRADVSTQTADLSGFDVEALDGSIGKIDEATYETGRGSMVVDTGFWIFGKKRLIPAGSVTRIDLEDRRVFVNLTKEQVKSAPDYDETRREMEDYRQEIVDYYGHLR